MADLVDGKYWKIDLEKLGKSAEIICKKLVQNNGRYLDTEKDYFWFIDMEAGLDLKKEPDFLSVGSLADDYLNLERLETEDDNVSILDLERIANLFRLISFEVENDKNKFI